MSPIDVQDILERAKNAAQVGDHEEVERLLKSYIARVPESREARLLLGTTFAKQGKLSEATDEFITLLSRDPKDVEALNNAAVMYRRQGKFQEALDYLKEAIDIEPTRAEFFYNIGNIHKQQNNLKAASMAYSKVIELDPSYVSAYNNLGTIYDQLKEYEKAFWVFRKGLALDHNNPTLHFNYGVSLEANGRLENAAEEYQSALRSKPGWLAPMNNLGNIHFKLGQHNKALTQFNRILSADPFNAEAYNNMGIILADQGRTKDAVKNYRKAIESDPRYIKAVINLERELETAGDFSDAIVELEKLVKLTPDSADIRNRLAGLYLKMERYPEALEQAGAALDWEPENIQSLRIKGATQRILGNDKEAQACFEKILALDPGNYSFLLDLADIHFRRKEYREAEERLQAYLIRRPNDRNAKLLLGKLYAEMGNRTHAIQIFEELSKNDPNDAEALAAAAELQKKAGLLEKALRSADTLVNLQGKRGTADDLSDLNKSLEFYENAVNAYSSSVRDMWDRNIKLMMDETGTDRNSASADDDIDLLMGAAGSTIVIDEETEALFSEGPETFSDEEEGGDLVVGDDNFDSFGEEPEGIQPALSKDPLDALVDAPSPPPHFPFPEGSSSEAPREPHEHGDNVPPDNVPSDNTPPGNTHQDKAPDNSYPFEDEDTALLPPEPEDTTPVPEEEDEELIVEEEAPEDIFGEEIPEDIAGEVVEPEQEPEAEESEPEEPEHPELEEPQPEYPEPEQPEPESELEPEPAFAKSEEKIEPEAEVPAEETQEIPAEPDDDKNITIPAVIDLLNYLKTLTVNLPTREQKSFQEGKFPASLRTVIDSLERLTIIKESAAKPKDSGQMRPEDSGPGDSNGSGF